LTYHGDARRSGNFVISALTWDKARALQLDRAFDAHVAGHVYGQPLYWRGSGSNGAVIVVATEDDVVQAFDATTGKELWKRSVGRPVARSLLPCGNINPLGITGTPAHLLRRTSSGGLAARMTAGRTASSSRRGQRMRAAETGRSRSEISTAVSLECGCGPRENKTAQ